jgi:hypothetical protein
VAIKDFSSGPQNYFEPGYFNGDYTEPNVSRASLLCDADRTVGFQVLAGFYFEEGYFDGDYTAPNITRAGLICDADRTVSFQFLAGFYFEEGFIEDGAFGVNSVISTLTADAMIVQEATVGLQGYYSEGYYATGYYESRGSQFVLTAELEKVGQTVEVEAAFSTQFSQVALAGKSVEITLALSSEFTQTTVGSRSKDIDLFAFSEAAIAIQVDIIKDNNASLSSVFDIATDGRRFRDVAAAEDSQFDFDAIIERSRAFNIETQAAFSISADNDKIKDAESSIQSTASLTAIISHIEGADIVLNNFGTLTCQIDDRVRDQSVSMQAQFAQTAVNTRVRFAQSSQLAQLFQTAESRRIRFGSSLISVVLSLTAVSEKYKTPGRITLPMASSVSATVKSNPSEINLSDYDIFPTDFSASFEWQFPRNVADSYNDLIDYYTRVPPVFSVTGGSGGLQVSYSNGQGDDYLFVPVAYLKRVGTDLYQLYVRERQYSISASVTNGLSTNTWRSFGVEVSPINQTTGAFTITASFPMASFANGYSEGAYDTYNIKIAGNPNYVFFPVDPDNLLDGSSGSGLGQVTSYRNATYSRLGTIYRYDNLPIIASADLVNLNFGTLTANVLNVKFGAASLSAQFNRSITASRTRLGVANLSVIATRLVIATEVNSTTANLSAQTQLIANGVKVTFLAADTSAVFNQTADLDRIRFGQSQMAANTNLVADVDVVGSGRIDVNANFSQSTVNSRTRNFIPQLDSIASQLTAAFRNATGTVLLESTTALTAQAERTTRDQIALEANTALDAINSRIRYNFSLQSSEFNLSIGGEKLQLAGAELISITAQTTNTANSKITGASAQLSTTTALTASADRSRNNIVLQVSAGTLVCDNQVLRLATATLNVESEIIASPTFIVRITVEFTAFNTQLTVGEVLNLDPALTYLIPQETREFQILPETRLYYIASESRELIILKG